MHVYVSRYVDMVWKCPPPQKWKMTWQEVMRAKEAFISQQHSKNLHNFSKTAATGARSVTIRIESAALRLHTACGFIWTSYMSPCNAFSPWHFSPVYAWQELAKTKGCLDAVEPKMLDRNKKETQFRHGCQKSKWLLGLSRRRTSMSNDTGMGVTCRVPHTYLQKGGALTASARKAWQDWVCWSFLQRSSIYLMQNVRLGWNTEFHLSLSKGRLQYATGGAKAKEKTSDSDSDSDSDFYLTSTIG